MSSKLMVAAIVLSATAFPILNMFEDNLRLRPVRATS